MSKRLLCKHGAFAGQIVEYSDAEAENALISGWAVPMPVIEVADEPKAETPEALPVWPKKISPANYLKRYPGGDLAALAQAILAR